MSRLLRSLALTASAMALLAPIASQAQYSRLDLDSDNTALHPALHQDPNLVNPWGISSSAASPFWVSDNGTGLATLYNTAGVAQGLVVSIPQPPVPSPPPPPASPTSTPTGQVFAGGAGFVIAPGTNAAFIFAEEDGTITAWGGGTNAVLKVDNSQTVYNLPGGGTVTGAVYKGLAMGNNGAANFLYAANFRAGKIDVFNTNFAPTALAGSFTDPSLPAGYAPFNIQAVGGKLYVTYAQQTADRHDDVSGAGNGFIDTYDFNGNFLQRFASGTSVGGTLTQLDSPWGLTMAPSGFGQFKNDLLVGNFGDGHINAFDPNTNAFLGQLTDASNNPLAIDGLWGLINGNGGNGGNPASVYFSAGPDGETHGIFGRLQATPEPGAYATFLIGALTTAGCLRRRAAKRK
jgi:uncharacterized protein (TIGR03118 family)